MCGRSTFSVLLILSCTIHTILGQSVDEGTQLFIIGGTRTDLNKYRWLVSIQYNFNHLCGGSLISDRLVLTAAHCVFTEPPEFRPRTADELDVWLRFDTQDNRGAAAMKIDLVEIVVHELYDAHDPNHDYDIAILRLAQPAFNHTFPPGVPYDQQYVKLAPADFLYSRLIDEKLRIVGWGIANVNVRTSSSTLQEALVEYLPPEECERIYAERSSYRPTKFVMCTNSTGRDVCQGDSGGPLLLESVDADGVLDFLQVGIVSLSSSG